MRNTRSIPTQAVLPPLGDHRCSIIESAMGTARMQNVRLIEEVTHFDLAVLADQEDDARSPLPQGMIAYDITRYTRVRILAEAPTLGHPPQTPDGPADLQRDIRAWEEQAQASRHEVNGEAAAFSAGNFRRFRGVARAVRRILGGEAERWQDRWWK